MHRVIRDLVQWPFVVIVSTSALLALVIPPGWLQAVPGLGALLRIATEYVPAIGGYVRHSRFPDVAAVYFPMMLLISPLHSVWIWQTMSRSFWTDEFRDHSIRGALRLLGALVLTFFVGFATWVEGGGQLGILPWNDSRLALALAGYIVAGGGFFIALTTVALGLHALVKRITVGALGK